MLELCNYDVPNIKSIAINCLNLCIFIMPSYLAQNI